MPVFQAFWGIINLFIVKYSTKRQGRLASGGLALFYCRWSPIAGSTVFTSAIRNQYCRHYSANHKRVHPTAILRDEPFLFAFRLLADIHPALSSGGCFQLLQDQLDGGVAVAHRHHRADSCTAGAFQATACAACSSSLLDSPRLSFNKSD